MKYVKRIKRRLKGWEKRYHKGLHRAYLYLREVKGVRYIQRVEEGLLIVSIEDDIDGVLIREYPIMPNDIDTKDIRWWMGNTPCNMTYCERNDYDGAFRWVSKREYSKRLDRMYSILKKAGMGELLKMTPTRDFIEVEDFVKSNRESFIGRVDDYYED